MMRSPAGFDYITKIRLENIRAFERLEVGLEADKGPRMLSVIIGRNGTCKSTLLRCIALALCQEQDASALLALPNTQMLSEGAREGRIEVEFAGPADTGSVQPARIALVLGRKGDRDVVMGRSTHRQKDSMHSFFACGYGAGRGRTGPTTRRAYRVMDSVSMLFDYERTFADPELILRRLRDFLGTDRYENAIKGIKRVLGLGPDDRISVKEGGGVRISGPAIGADIPLEGWADGYRLTFDWLIDLYGWALQAEAIGENGNVQGILLIDEVEQHLHPAMQREILGDLAEALPEMQIFATTHSPLVAVATRSENLVALHRKGKRVEAAAVPSLEGYSVEDALVEESLFGTDPYPPETRERLDSYRKLAAIPPERRKPPQVDELRRLAEQLDPALLPGLRDDPTIKRLRELTDKLAQEGQA
jgi:hypothetical protein